MASHDNSRLGVGSSDSLHRHRPLKLLKLLNVSPARLPLNGLQRLRFIHPTPDALPLQRLLCALSLLSLAKGSLLFRLLCIRVYCSCLPEMRLPRCC